MVKNLPAIWETWVGSLGWEDPLEEYMATHCSILAWRILMELQRVRHDWATEQQQQKVKVEGGMKGQSTESCWGSKMTLCITTWWTHVIAHSKPIECKTPRVNLSVNYGLWLWWFDIASSIVTNVPLWRDMGYLGNIYTFSICSKELSIKKLSEKLGLF